MTDPIEPVRPAERSRRGGGAIWIGAAVIGVLALALFGFLLVPDGRVGDDLGAPEAVLVDDGAAPVIGD